MPDPGAIGEEGKDLTQIETLQLARDSNLQNTPFLLRNKLRSATRVVDALEKVKTATGEQTTISINKLHVECKIKRDRATRATVGWRFMVFFLLYAVVLTMQRNAVRGEAFTYGVFNYYINSKFYSPRTSRPDSFPNKFTTAGGCRGYLGEETPDGCWIPPGELKSFRDVVTMEDLWDWLQIHFVPKYYISEEYNGQTLAERDVMTINYRSKSMGGFRLTQKRMSPGSVTKKDLGGRCWSFNDGEIREFTPTCYDSLQLCQDGTCLFGAEDHNSFGTFLDPEKYKWKSYDVGSKQLGIKETGFIEFFPHTDVDEATKKMAEIKADRWLDRASQWLRIDVSYLNSNERLILVLRILFHMDNKGFIQPIVVSDVTQVVWYNFQNYLDIIRISLEFCVVFMWATQVWDIFKKVLKKRRQRKCSWGRALKAYQEDPSHSWVMDILLSMFFVIFIIWIIVVTDPLKGNINVNPQFMTWGSEGQPMFLTQVSNFERSYFLVNGVCCILFVLRMLQIAKVNPRFSLLSESLDAMKGRLFNFAIVMFILLIFFTVQAMVMFGDKLPVFNDFGYAFVAIVQILIGSGGSEPNEMRSRRGGGFGALLSVDYPQIKEVAPSSAWLFYYPFVFMMVFVVVNITIAIIGEAYVRVKRARDPNNPEFNLCPSEALAGKPTPILQQISRGLMRRFGRVLRKEKNVERQKADILTMILKLPQWIDRDCCSVGDLADVAGPLGFTRESIMWLTTRYPVVVNNEATLKQLLAKRTPPPPTVAQQLEHVTASVEELVNTQAGIHAKLDLLIRMATL
uniref:Uncharacterized protein n=2 Tax=Hemiselmis andersenii TaxID=464988 RepID=A0A6U2DAR5_HEMAN|mmetsp:Transcript_23498/g.54628  ORF Transcript_23498/g.54628 Transcript_23498/m.54628 type:complete len:797 (+) Transcript_23498:124-2514(+)